MGDLEVEVRGEPVADVGLHHGLEPGVRRRRPVVAVEHGSIVRNGVADVVAATGQLLGQDLEVDHLRAGHLRHRHTTAQVRGHLRLGGEPVERCDLPREQHAEQRGDAGVVVGQGTRLATRTDMRGDGRRRAGQHLGGRRLRVLSGCRGGHAAIVGDPPVWTRRTRPGCVDAASPQPGRTLAGTVAVAIGDTRPASASPLRIPTVTTDARVPRTSTPRGSRDHPGPPQARRQRRSFRGRLPPLENATETGYAQMRHRKAPTSVPTTSAPPTKPSTAPPSSPASHRSTPTSPRRRSSTPTPTWPRPSPSWA